MKKYFGYFLTILVLLSTLLFLVFILQGQEEQLLFEKYSLVASEINGKEPVDQESEFEKAAIGDVIAIEEEFILPSFPVSLKYHNYKTTYTYFLVEREMVEVRSGPSFSETVIKRLSKNDKVNYIETVFVKTGENTSDQWYHITWNDNGDTLFGFVNSNDVTKRFFQFDKMEKAVNFAQEYADRGKLTYINNYKNQTGYAPFYHGGTVDEFGNERSQSAPGYFDLSNLQEFIYIEDGTLVKYLFTKGDYIKVQLLSTGETYFVPRKYIPTDRAVTSLKKIVVIDRMNQNEAVYENIQGTWTMISYSLATTGTVGEYSQITPLGYFYAVERREQFLYYKDGTYQIQGYAPYVIRFNGGAYIHGVATNYKYNSKGQIITPPIQEYSKTIGTVPLSHKCVRNYTSHAKFLYDWYTPGETIVVVIE